MFCKNCGAEIIEGSNFCLNCGTSVASGENRNKFNTLSTVGLIVAAISLLLNFWGLVGIAAVILSSIGLIQINRTGEKGKGIAITGILLGAFSIIYGFTMILLMV